MLAVRSPPALFFRCILPSTILQTTPKTTVEEVPETDGTPKTGVDGMDTEAPAAEPSKATAAATPTAMETDEVEEME